MYKQPAVEEPTSVPLPQTGRIKWDCQYQLLAKVSSLFNFPSSTSKNAESSWAAELCALPEEPPSVRVPWPCLSFVGEGEAVWNNGKVMHSQLKLGLSSHCEVEPFTSAGTYGCRNEKAEHLKALKRDRDSAAWLTRSFHGDFHLSTENLCVQLGRVLHHVKEGASQPSSPSPLGSAGWVPQEHTVPAVIWSKRSLDKVQMSFSFSILHKISRDSVQRQRNWFPFKAVKLALILTYMWTVSGCHAWQQNSGEDEFFISALRNKKIVFRTLVPQAGGDKARKKQAETASWLLMVVSHTGMSAALQSQGPSQAHISWTNTSLLYEQIQRLQLCLLFIHTPLTDTPVDTHVIHKYIEFPK